LKQAPAPAVSAASAVSVEAAVPMEAAVEKEMTEAAVVAKDANSDDVA